MHRTPIQWTEFANNPIEARPRGSGPEVRSGHYCEKIGPDCLNCYASTMQPRFGLPQFQHQRGENMPDLFLNPKKLQAVLDRKKPTKIFWCDMTDLFGWWVPFEWIAACFGIMAATPQHTHQLLTKRTARALEFFNWMDREDPDGGGFPMHVQVLERNLKAAAGIEAKGPGIDWPLPNVHLGMSAGNQKMFDERWPFLRECPAAVRWVSAEPLIGALDMRGPLEIDREIGKARWVRSGWKPEIDWVVPGGESGRRARQARVEHVEFVVEQCQAAGVPVFTKQLGSNVVVASDRLLDGFGQYRPDGKMYQVESLGQIEPRGDELHRIRLQDSHGGRPQEWPERLRVREFPIPRTA